MGIHVCGISGQCRELGTPKRVYFNFKSGQLIVALWPNAKVLQNEKFQWITWWKSIPK